MILNALHSVLREPAVIAGCDGRVLSVNNAFSVRFGVDEAAIKGASIVDLCGDEALSKDCAVLPITLPGRLEEAAFAQVMIRAMRAGERVAGYCATCLDGLKDCSAEPCDVDYLDQAIEAVPQGVIVWDASDRLVVANEKARARYRAHGIELVAGCERVATLAAGMRAGVFGTKYVGLERAIKALTTLRGRDREPTAERVGIERLSDDRWLKVTSHLMPSKWLLSFYEEITALDTDKQKLVTSADYFNTLLQYVPDLIVHIGPDYRIEYANAAFAAATGRSVSELIGQPSNLYFDDALGAPIGDILNDVTPENANFSFDRRWKKGNGEFAWLRWSANALFSDDKAVGIVATGRDISLEYQQQINLKDKSDELAKKNRSLEQFAAVVSHDLKAPLRHIAVFADMMVEDIENGEMGDLQSYAQQVRQSAQRMDRVVRKLLEYSQVAYKLVSYSRVALADVTIQAIQNIEREIEEARAEVLLSNLPSLSGDPDLLRQVMQNLIGNAVKYRRSGVTPKIRIYATEGARSVNLFVEDNGIGIDPKYSETIFTAFQRLHRDDRVYDGFGIGLALCRQIVESHKGTIELDTSYDQGARFTIRLPMSPSPSE